VNSERLQPGNDIGHDGDLADGSMDNDLIGRDAFGFALGYYGDNDFAAIANAWTSTPGERAFTPIGVDVPANTLATNHAPLYNGNIAHTVYTLQPFGAGWDIGNTEGQVLAQVYTYDQLNRLKKARGVVGLTNTNTWIGVTDGATNRYRSQYEYDANGNIISANRYDNDGDHYDQFAYKYQKRDGRTMRNRLYELYDDADAADDYVNEMGGAQDINYNQTITNPLDPAYFDEEAAELNGLHNYHYDALGNLIHDGREQIQAIQWTVAGKVKSVSRTTGSIRKPLSFAYGASGQRILKNVSDPDLDVTGSREHYIRDAQGNIMATYRYTNPGSASLQLNDRPLYGSSRLGTLGEEMELHSLLNWDPADPVIVDPVDLNYELTDHLGNVCTVVTGRLMDGNGGGTLKQAELMSAQGYEPFGSLLPGRNYSSSSYNYGFQGQLKDDEINGATGTSYAFEYRIHDPRVGRFLSIDPLAAEFPHNSPYAFSENRVLDAIELEGLEAVLIIGGADISSTGRQTETIIQLRTDIEQYAKSNSIDNLKITSLVQKMGDPALTAAEAIDWIKANHCQGEPLVLYGYSMGGATVAKIAQWMDTNMPNTPITQMVLVDAAVTGDLFTGAVVNDNVLGATNYHQDEKNVLGSRGYPAVAAPGNTTTSIDNQDYSNHDFSKDKGGLGPHGKMDEVTLGAAASVIKRAITTPATQSSCSEEECR
jgi:RHS repeat-associated protein